MRTFVIINRLVLAVILCAPASWAQSGLADASLEQLLDIQITTVSKKEQTLARSAAAVFVLGAEDIRRSGAQTLPDLLRLVPGVQVAQVDANTWAIAIRGFNNRYSDKVLILIDGRAVYTPTFGGVYWDQIDLPVENIERIEVIRGPGASVWGANAVNGVISVITHPAKATQGGLAVASVGSDQSSQDLLQYGGAAGTRGTYRVFGKYSRLADQSLPDGGSADDGMTRIHGGFRTDWAFNAHDNVSVQGDWFANREGQTRTVGLVAVPGYPTFTESVAANGGDLLLHWTHTHADGATTEFQAYYDTYRRNDLGGIESTATKDLDVQHHFAPFGAHDIVVGGGFRSADSAIRPQSAWGPYLEPRTEYLYSAFLQDEIRLASTVWLTAGSKFEHNSQTGFEYEPSFRMVWTPTTRHSLWAAASRAIRQPSRADDTLQFPRTSADASSPGNVAPSVGGLLGNPNFRSEVLHDFELGYRIQWTSKLSFDAGTYYSTYRDLETLETQAQPSAAGLPTGAGQTTSFSNNARSRDFGGEIAVNWIVNEHWRLIPSYSLLRMNFNLDSASNDTFSRQLAAANPRNQAGVRSQINLGHSFEWDQTIAWVERLENGSAPAQLRLDTRFGWRAGNNLQFSVVGRNLVRAGVMEFTESPFIQGAVSRRTVFGRISWTF